MRPRFGANFHRCQYEADDSRHSSVGGGCRLVIVVVNAAECAEQVSSSDAGKGGDTHWPIMAAAGGDNIRQ